MLRTLSPHSITPKISPNPEQCVLAQSIALITEAGPQTPQRLEQPHSLLAVTWPFLGGNHSPPVIGWGFGGLKQGCKTLFFSAGQLPQLSS